MKRIYRTAESCAFTNPKDHYNICQVFDCLDCNILFAFSNSRLREAGRLFPARFKKYCIIRMPEPTPLGLTFFEAMCRAIVSASLVNMPFSGKVDSVVTPLTHRFLPLLLFRDGISILVPQSELTFAG